MANHRSAVKRHRQSVARHARNQAVRSNMRTLVKQLRAQIDAGNAEGAKSQVKDVIRALDKAATKGVLHRNSASRRISRLTAAVAKLG